MAELTEHDARWPAWVYGSGAEPDYRFTFANERTFLAYIRTAVALLAASLAVGAFDLGLVSWAAKGLTFLLAALAVLASVTAWLQWARNERALRAAKPLPASLVNVVLGLGVAACCTVLMVAAVR